MLARPGVHHQEPSRIARRGGLERDAVLGKVKSEKVGTHGGGRTRGAHNICSPWALGAALSRAGCDMAQRSAATLSEVIRSGFCTGSPRLILSTLSMPSTTLPQTVYCRSRNGASSKQIKNWLLALFGFCARAMEHTP